MKIVNVCLCGSYHIGWGYQDNLIAKYQAKNNNKVTVIASNLVYDNQSENIEKVKDGVYYDGLVKVIRLKNKLPIFKYLRIYKDLYMVLSQEKPDIIFIHGCQFLSIISVCNYLDKNPGVKCCVDNHADYTNSALTVLAKLVHKTLWKYTANRINKHASVFYGVLPIRCDFLHEMYGIQRNKIKLLIMGADDEYVEASKKNINITRKKYNISKSDFLIVSGGKIDIYKKDIINLLKAYKKFDNNKIKLIIFGSLYDELKDEFNNNLGKAMYIGWLNQIEIYDLLCASDLAVYPGRHSVLWEQTVGCGVPTIFKDLPNTYHIDVGGNCIISKDISSKFLYNTILNLIENKNKYNNMKKISETEGISAFSYRNIAKKSIETILNNIE